MSADDDRDSKTEPATEKKIYDARSKGNVPQSRDFILFASLFGMFLSSYFFFLSSSEKLSHIVRYLLQHAGQIRIINTNQATIIFSDLAEQLTLVLSTVMIIIALSGVIGCVIQSIPNMSSQRVRPQFSRVSISGGLKRLFGFGSLIDFGKTAIKITVIFSVLSYFAFFYFYDISRFFFFSINQIFYEVWSGVNHALLLTLFFVLIVAVVDIFLVRSRWQRDLRMTPKEVKDELKESDGNPLLKSHRRMIAIRRSRRRMLHLVPESTLILTNPTHFSVALRYDRSKDIAPIVLAKGQDLIALKIRQIASESNVPIIENKQLARALYKSVEVNQVIPIEFYRAVAEVITILQNTPRLKSAF